MDVQSAGRRREIDAIVEHERAVEVANLMMGKLNRALRPIFPEQYLAIPRRNLRSGLHSLRDGRQRDLALFCKRNFGTQDFKRLSRLYERLFQSGTPLRLPLTEFAKLVGVASDDIFRGAPRHSTVSISPWGLQTEFPELHLARDVKHTYNLAIALDCEFASFGSPPWIEAKQPEFKRRVADTKGRSAVYMRMCVLSCFNLIEAYINGIAWEFADVHGLDGRSNSERKLFTAQASILERLTKIPCVVARRSPGPLCYDQNPLKEFKEVIKPYRDSVVHASPFSAPEQFGGYDKLSRIYELTAEMVTKAVKLTLDIIACIHRFLHGDRPLPNWVPLFQSDGSLDVNG